MIDLTWLAAPLGLVGVAIAIALSVGGDRGRLLGDSKADAGTNVHRAAAAFLKRTYLVLAVFVAALGALLGFMVDPYAAGAFVLGALLSAAASAFSLWLAGKAAPGGENTRRDVQAATPAFMSAAAATGLAVVSLGLMGAGALYYLLVHRPGAFTQIELLDFASVIAPFALGVSTNALLTRISAGIFSGAADARGHLKGAGAASEGRADGRASLTGHALTDIAGFGAEVQELAVSATVAGIVLGVTGGAFATQRPEAVALPILTMMAGLVSSLLVLVGMRTMAGARPARLLRSASLLAVAIFLILAYFVVAGLAFEGRDAFTGRTYIPSGPYWAIFAGSLLGLAMSFATEYYTTWRPLRRVARDSERGAAATLLSGLAVGFESTLMPIFCLSVVIGVAYYFAGMYGIGMAAVGLAGTLAVTLAVEVYGSVGADEPGPGVGRGGPGAARGETLDLLGGSVRGIGRGFSSAASAVIAVALLAAYSSAVGLSELGIHLISPLVLIGLLLGSVLPFLTAGLTLGGINRTARSVGAQAETDAMHRLDLPLRRTLLETVVPVLLVLLVTLLAGFGLGLGALAGLTGGALLAGSLLSIFLANAGGALQNAYAYRASSGGGRRDEAADAAVTGALLGTVFSSACGPAVSSVIKFIAILSLALAPWFAELWTTAAAPVGSDILLATISAPARAWLGS